MITAEQPIAGPDDLEQICPKRLQAVIQAEIDYIPNESFEMGSLPTEFRVDEFLNSSDSDRSSPRELPAHLKRLCETELLTPEVEATLFRQMNFLKFLASDKRDGLDLENPAPQELEAIETMLWQAQQIRDHIIQANMRLVISIVKKFVTPCQSFDEMLSEGTVTLMQAVEKFDFDRGFRFSTYAYRSISRTAYRFVSAAREEESRLTRDADEWAFGQSEEEQSSMSDNLWNGLRELTAGMLHRLDRRERFIIRCRYALGSHRRVRTFQDLANRLGVSKERVRQIEARAVAKLQAMAKECDLDSIRMSAS